MRPEIASLQERMSKGGDWMKFRDEIASLHAEANTEEEYVLLLQAHRILVSVGEHAYDENTWKKLLPVTTAEYRTFLAKEAMEDGHINPVLADRITRREVEAGRLAADDELRALAKAGGAVLGDSAGLNAHHCRQGSWFCYGVLAAVAVSTVLARFGWSPWWVVALGFVVGWFINEREAKRIRLEIVARRSGQK